MDQTIETLSTGKYLHVKATGKLSTESYEVFTPIVEQQIEDQGKVRILFEMHDFHGWTCGAMWEDLKFDFKHWRDIERLALVGDSKWEAGMAVFCKPFTAAKIQYFDVGKIEDAKAWLEVD